MNSKTKQNKELHYLLPSTGFDNPSCWNLTAAGSGCFAAKKDAVSHFQVGPQSGQVILASQDVARYAPGTNNIFYTQLRLSNDILRAGLCRWGVFDEHDGFFFELRNGLINGVCRKQNKDTSLSTNKFQFNLDTQTHVYEISYHAHSAEFYRDNILIHKVSSPTETLINNLHLPCQIQLTLESPENLKPFVFCSACTVLREAKTSFYPMSFNVDKVGVFQLDNTAGNLQSITINKTSSSAQLCFYDGDKNGKLLLRLTPTHLATLQYFISYKKGLFLEITGDSAPEVSVSYN